MKLSEIKTIIKDFETSTLTILELEADDVKLKLSKNKETTIEKKSNNNEVINNTITTNQIDFIEPKTDEVQIKSPLVGTFYESNKPTGKAFVTVGSKVTKGQALCIVEAMKIMNEITSPTDGVIKTISFKNGDVVGFDDVLFTVVK